MISLKQHAISIAAIFLALAIGIVLGSHLLSAGLISGLRDDEAGSRRDSERLQEENNQLRAQLTGADGFNTALSGRIVHDALAGRSVTVISAPGADSSDADAVARLIVAAGAKVSARIGLAPGFTESGNAERLRSTVTNVIPAGVQLRTDAADPGSLAGDLLGSVLQLTGGNGTPQSSPQERALALETLRTGGFLSYSGDIAPGNLVVILAGGDPDSADNGRGSVLARFCGAIDRRGAGAVLAGRGAATIGEGAVSIVRSDAGLAAAVSTVDNVDRPIGRITTVLALQEQLRGGAGRYGTGPKATSITVG